MYRRVDTTLIAFVLHKLETDEEWKVGGSFSYTRFLSFHSCANESLTYISYFVDKMIQDILYMEKLFFQRDAINNYDRNYYTFDWKL